VVHVFHSRFCLFTVLIYLLIEVTKVETQIYYKSRVGMPVNLALCIEWAHGWECR